MLLKQDSADYYLLYNTEMLYFIQKGLSLVTVYVETSSLMRA